MVGSKARKRAEKILEPLGRLGDKWGLTPNKITLLGFCISCLSGLMIIFSDFLPPKFFIPEFSIFIPQLNRIIFLGIAVILFFLSGFFDVFDGAVARYQKSITKFGGFLDSILDRCSDAIILFSLIVSGYCDIYIGIIALIGSLLVSYTRARGEAGGLKAKHMAIGIAERSERMLIILVAIVIQGTILYFNPWSILNQQWGVIGIAIAILAIITHITVIQRMYSAYKNFQKERIIINNNRTSTKISLEKEEQS